MSRGPGRSRRCDAVVVGAGPNGLAAAVVLARAGLSTLIVEAADLPGGGARTLPLTLPGFRHDPCSTVHPLGIGSPFFRELDLESYGLEWVHPPAPLAHVLADGSVLTLERSLESTAAQLGRDARAYTRLFEPLVERFETLLPMLLGPLRWPPAPLLLARFGRSGLRSMRGLANARFRERAAPALLAGMAAHSMLPLGVLGTAAFALVLGMAGHRVGWPLARGGSQAITDALLRCLRAHGGELRVGCDVKRLADLPEARAYLLDVTPRQLLAIAGELLPEHYRRRLRRYRYGPGVFKLDWALAAPIPWVDPRCSRAGTVHLAGDLEEIDRAEALPHAGEIAPEPFVILVQPTLFDPTRAPVGQHVAWAYCHVPNAATRNVAAQIEKRIERFAPGFRERILARAARNALDLQSYNANYVGGDISGGQNDLGQLFTRPVARLDPYSTPAPDVFLCSSSTPPGAGVHGMCGYFAAQSALRRVFGRDVATARPPESA